MSQQASRTDSEDVFKRLGAQRAERGPSRQALADTANVNYPTTGYRERGDRRPSLVLALKLSDYFRLPVEAIFSLTPRRPPTEQIYRTSDPHGESS